MGLGGWNYSSYFDLEGCECGFDFVHGQATRGFQMRVVVHGLLVLFQAVDVFEVFQAFSKTSSPPHLILHLALRIVHHYLGPRISNNQAPCIIATHHSIGNVRSWVPAIRASYLSALDAEVKIGLCSLLRHLPWWQNSQMSLQGKHLHHQLKYDH